MVKKADKNRIDAQWQALQPGWGSNDYKGERRILYDNHAMFDNIEGLWAAGWKCLMGRQAVESHDRGVIAATSQGIYLLNRGRLSKNLCVIEYEEIKELEDTGSGEVRIKASSVLSATYTQSYVALFPPGAANSFVNYVRPRLPTSTASVEAELARILYRGESIQFWTRCSGGEEGVSERVRSTGPGGPGGTPHERWWEVQEPREIFAAATDRRVLLVKDFKSSNFASVPYADLLTMMHQGDTLKFARQGSSRVYALQMSQKDAHQFANLMQSNWSSQGLHWPKSARILAEWQMLQPIWSHRNTHDKERNKLPELMEDGERLEGLLGGHFHAEAGGEISRDGVVAATDRRLIFLSEGILDKHAGQISYEELAEVKHEKGQIHHEVRFIAKPGYTGYWVSSIDDQRPTNTRQSGYAEEFAALVQGCLGNSTTAAPASNSPVVSAESKRSRVNAQWQERSPSPGWKLDTRKNEREKLYEVLDDDEEIERLIQGNYKLDQKGAESHDVVVAATDQRLVFVYNGWAGAHLNWMRYGQIERVEDRDGILSGQHITIVTRGGGAVYDVEVAGTEDEHYAEGMSLFVDCVRSHIVP